MVREYDVLGRARQIAERDYAYMKSPGLKEAQIRAATPKRMNEARRQLEAEDPDHAG